MDGLVGGWMDGWNPYTEGYINKRALGPQPSSQLTIGLVFDHMGCMGCRREKRARLFCEGGAAEQDQAGGGSTKWRKWT
eukprot:scaffold207835_cov42-Prasinocladus_malaysianus.AAC.1